MFFSLTRLILSEISEDMQWLLETGTTRAGEGCQDIPDAGSSVRVPIEHRSLVCQ